MCSPLWSYKQMTWVYKLGIAYIMMHRGDP